MPAPTSQNKQTKSLSTKQREQSVHVRSLVLVSQELYCQKQVKTLSPTTHMHALSRYTPSYHRNIRTEARRVERCPRITTYPHRVYLPTHHISLVRKITTHHQKHNQQRHPHQICHFLHGFLSIFLPPTHPPARPPPNTHTKAKALPYTKKYCLGTVGRRWGHQVRSRSNRQNPPKPSITTRFSTISLVQLARYNSRNPKWIVWKKPEKSSLTYFKFPNKPQDTEIHTR